MFVHTFLHQQNNLSTFSLAISHKPLFTLRKCGGGGFKGGRVEWMSGHQSDATLTHTIFL